MQSLHPFVKSDSLAREGDDEETPTCAGPSLMPLHKAALEGNIAVLKEMLASFPDKAEYIERRGGMSGRTALLFALQDVDATSILVHKQKRECAKALLEAGANVNCADRRGVVPLTMAIRSKRVSPSLLKMLLHFGADVNHQCRQGRTALMAAARAPRHFDLDLVSILLSHGARVNTADKAGYTALHMAIMDRKTEVVERLVQVGADLYTKTTTTKASTQRSPLEFWSASAYLQALPKLVGKGLYPSPFKPTEAQDIPWFSVESYTHILVSPLMRAIGFGSRNAVETIMDTWFLTGADIKWLLPGNRTILKRVLSSPSEELYDSVVIGPCPLLMMAFVKVSDLIGASQQREEKVKKLGLPPFLQQRLLFKTSKSQCSYNCYTSKHYQSRCS